MPQPLSTLAVHGMTFSFGEINRPLARHRDLALLAMEVIASWAEVETHLLNLYIKMMGGAEDAAAAVYLALDTQKAKNGAISAVAKVRLSEQNQHLLRAILRIAKTSQKARDNVAHGRWGDSLALPDVLLLWEPVTRGQHTGEGIYVYGAKDFIEAIQANHRLCGFVSDLQNLISIEDAVEQQKRCDWLWSQPEIQEMRDGQASPNRSLPEGGKSLEEHIERSKLTFEPSIDWDLIPEPDRKRAQEVMDLLSELLPLIADVETAISILRFTHPDAPMTMKWHSLAHRDAINSIWSFSEALHLAEEKFRTCPALRNTLGKQALRPATGKMGTDFPNLAEVRHTSIHHIQRLATREDSKVNSYMGTGIVLVNCYTDAGEVISTRDKKIVSITINDDAVKRMFDVRQMAFKPFLNLNEKLAQGRGPAG